MSGIAYQIRVKTGVLSDMDGFSVMPYYVSELSDEIRVGELEEGAMPEKENEVAVQGAMARAHGNRAGGGQQCDVCLL